MGFSNFKIEGRGLGKRTDSGIPVILYGQTRIPDPRQGKDLPGYHAGSFLTESSKSPVWLRGAISSEQGVACIRSGTSHS